MNDWKRINDWGEMEGILAGDGSWWMLVCGGSEGLYTFVNRVGWGCVCREFC